MLEFDEVLQNDIDSQIERKQESALAVHLLASEKGKEFTGPKLLAHSNFNPKTWLLNMVMMWSSSFTKVGILHLYFSKLSYMLVWSSLLYSGRQSPGRSQNCSSFWVHIQSRPSNLPSLFFSLFLPLLPCPLLTLLVSSSPWVQVM